MPRLAPLLGALVLCLGPLPGQGLVQKLARELWGDSQGEGSRLQSARAREELEIPGWLPAERRAKARYVKVALVATRTQIENVQFELGVLAESLASLTDDDLSSIQVDIAATSEASKEGEEEPSGETPPTNTGQEPPGKTPEPGTGQEPADPDTTAPPESGSTGEDGGALSKARLEEEVRLKQEALDRFKDRLDRFRQRDRELTSLLVWPNPLHWLQHHGIALLVIVLITVGLTVGFRTGLRRLARRAGGGTGAVAPSSPQRQRAETLGAALRRILTLLLVGGGLIALLAELGVDQTALLIGVGAVALVASISSQTLVRDFFSGLCLLLEKQFALGDIVTINETITGRVESFGLRTTALRSFDGQLHFIPNSRIELLSNLTHGHSMTLLDVPVPYSEDADAVLAILGEELRAIETDPDWETVVQGHELFGVDAFHPSFYTVRLRIRTTPGDQWAVKREFLRRLRLRFRAEGLPAPFPHRVLVDREDDDAAG